MLLVLALQPSDSLRMTTIESLGIPTVSISIQPRRLDPFPAFVLDSFFFVSVVFPRVIALPQTRYTSGISCPQPTRVQRLRVRSLDIATDNAKFDNQWKSLMQLSESYIFPGILNLGD